MYGERRKKINLLENFSRLVKYGWSLRMPHLVRDQLAPLTGYERTSRSNLQQVYSVCRRCRIEHLAYEVFGP